MKRLALAAVLAMSACSTAYQEDSGLLSTGGYEASMITPTRAVVSFRGNGYTSSDRVTQYVMLAAAETTHERGFGHFAIVGEDDDTQYAALINNYSALNFDGGNAYGWGTGTASSIAFPKTRLTIEMFPGGKPADAPSNVFNAADVINTIRPQIAAQ